MQWNLQFITRLNPRPHTLSPVVTSRQLGDLREIRPKHWVGTTIIFVTHDQVEAMTLADRIVIMKDGDIQQVGTPSEVFQDPANMFVAQFIGAPSMNMMPAILSENGVMLENKQMLTTRPKVAAAGDIMVGIRPSALTVTTRPKDAIIQGHVTVIEPLGAEALIYVDIMGREVIATVPGRTLPDTGDQVLLTTPADEIRFFDTVTGNALP